MKNQRLDHTAHITGFCIITIVYHIIYQYKEVGGYDTPS